MKLIITTLSILLILASPIFSALLTEDLQVITPTGQPWHSEHQTSECWVSSASNATTLRIIESGEGVIFVREYGGPGAKRFSQPVYLSKRKPLLTRFSTSNRDLELIKKTKVTLE